MARPKEYRVREGGLHDRARKSRAKVQVVGGGFGNGKTTWLVIRFLELSQWYPGSNLLLGRSTYPKLNDTLRKEFLAWCPQDWIERKPSKDDNTLVMKNGTTVNFRYIAQQGKTKESTSSNLLSATYDAVGIDQMEDPEIGAKDFKDLMGRLRGQTRYVGDDITMPRTGPRWFLITCNPTANWVYKDLVRPVHRFQQGIVDTKMIFAPKDQWSAPNKPKPWINVFEAPTHDNADNLPQDFIEGLEATYTGQMRERYLLGKWASFEGLVHPQWDETQHIVAHSTMLDLFEDLKRDYDVTIVEGYDFGQAVPSCYMYGFVDPWNNVHILDGFYKAEMDIREQAKKIWEIREEYGTATELPFADPSIFRRVPGGGEGMKGVGPSIAAMFEEHGISMQRGNNAVMNGVVKVNAYLTPANLHVSPYTGSGPSPHIYVSSKLNYVADEITEYYWKRNTEGEYEDAPQDRNDHAMNTLKYMLSDVPDIPQLSRIARSRTPAYMSWNEGPDTKSNKRLHRHKAA